jgi:hypothetical protein
MQSHDPRHPPLRAPHVVARPNSSSSQLVDPLVTTSHEATHTAHTPGIKQVRNNDPIAIDDDLMTGEGAAAVAAHRKIVAVGEAGRHIDEHLKRPTTKTGTGATRVKSFHGKYSDEGLRYLDHAINVWLDDHPDFEVKFVTSTVMTFEGKIREPALVLNVWY